MDAVSAFADHRLDVAHGPDIIRYRRWRVVDQVNLPSQIFNRLPIGTAQTIHIPPLDRILQHVARSGTIFG